MTRVLAMVMLLVAVLFAPIVAETQDTPGKMYRIGWLHPVTMPPTWMEAMRQGLRDHGYIEGRNLVVDSPVWGWPVVLARADEVIQ